MDDKKYGCEAQTPTSSSGLDEATVVGQVYFIQPRGWRA